MYHQRNIFTCANGCCVTKDIAGETWLTADWLWWWLHRAVYAHHHQNTPRLLHLLVTVYCMQLFCVLANYAIYNSSLSCYTMVTEMWGDILEATRWEKLPKHFTQETYYYLQQSLAWLWSTCDTCSDYNHANVCLLSISLNEYLLFSVILHMYYQQLNKKVPLMWKRLIYIESVLARSNSGIAM